MYIIFDGTYRLKVKNIFDNITLHNTPIISFSKHISSLDGETLLFLKRLNDRAPEFFYRFAHDRLGISDLNGLLRLDQALENLTD